MSLLRFSTRALPQLRAASGTRALHATVARHTNPEFYKFANNLAAEVKAPIDLIDEVSRPHQSDTI